MPRTLYQKIIRWIAYNAFIFGCLAILTVIGISFGKDFIKSQKIKKEIGSLQSDISKIEKKNIELSDFIRYLDSESYAEKKARTELGLKSPDEKVIIVPKGSEEKIDAVDSPELQNNVPKVPESNMVKWWRYFFSKNKKYDS